jgi:hypothetical protein
MRHEGLGLRFDISTRNGKSQQQFDHLIIGKPLKAMREESFP